MANLLRDLVVYFFYLLLLLFLAQQNRNTTAYYTSFNLRNLFVSDEFNEVRLSNHLTSLEKIH